MVEIQIPCEQPRCKDEVIHALCDDHLEELKDAAYTLGKKEGYNEGYDKGLEEAENAEEEPRTQV